MLRVVEDVIELPAVRQGIVELGRLVCGHLVQRQQLLGRGQTVEPSPDRRSEPSQFVELAVLLEDRSQKLRQIRSRETTGTAAVVLS